MKAVALTGGIGSGKTTVSAILTARGIPVYNSDKAAKKLYQRDDRILDAIEEAFGCSVRKPDGSFDGDVLAAEVFGNASRLKTLEAIVHPAVLRDFVRWTVMQATRFEGEGASEAFYGHKPFCVIESAIILDKPAFMARIDKVVLVEASASLCLKRACERDGADASQVLKRMSAQRFDAGMVDAFIRNDSSKEDLPAAVERAFRSLDI